MYSDPPRYAFLFQSYVQLTMLQLHTCKIPSPYKIMERSVYSAMCFVENLKRKNILHNAEVTVLEDWYDWCLKNANIETNLIGTYNFIYFMKSYYYNQRRYTSLISFFPYCLNSISKDNT